MRRFVSGRVMLGIVVVGLLAVTASISRASPESVSPVDFKVARGKDLVWSIGCNDCHTPKKRGPLGPELDTARLLSGHREEPNLPAPPALPEGP